MAPYVSRLLAERGKRADEELAWEFGKALDEKLGRGEELTPVEQLAWQVGGQTSRSYGRGVMDRLLGGSYYPEQYLH